MGEHHVGVGFEEFVGVVAPFFEETAGKGCTCSLAEERI